MLRLTRHSALWIAVFILAIAWPPIYSIFVHPVVYPSLVRGFVSPDELKQLLDARRYTIEVPMELDGHFLTFDAVVDGKVTRCGGASVVGGSRVILLLRRDQESRKIEYCWFGKDTLSRGIFDDPIAGAGSSTERTDGPIGAGDWLLRGGRTSVQVYPATDPAEFELRLAFGDP